MRRPQLRAALDGARQARCPVIVAKLDRLSPLMEALMQLARSLRQDTIPVLRAWISRRWD